MYITIFNFLEKYRFGAISYFVFQVAKWMGDYKPEGCAVLSLTLNVVAPLHTFPYKKAQDVSFFSDS